MIERVTTKRQLKKFIDFVKDLYSNEENYVLPFFRLQYKELAPLVLKEKSYHALLAIENGKTLGRLLYTFMPDHTRGKRVAYFSFFDFYENFEVAKALVDEMTRHAEKEGVRVFEGPYTPYDPDTRRGVLTNRFDALPSVFLSYNYPYYVDFYEKLGFHKATDTLSISLHLTDEVYKKAERLGSMMKGTSLSIRTLDRTHLEDDIAAVASVMAEATTEMNYEGAPDKETIAAIFNSMSLFIEDEYIVIAREKESGRAVGFIVILPELNQIFSKMKGRLDIVKYIHYRKRINKARGWLQYVIPEYQRTALLAMLLATAGKAMKKNGILYFEGGTVVEQNERSFGVYRHFGGEIDKRYRIFVKEDEV